MKRTSAPVVLLFVALAPGLAGVDLLLRRSRTVEQGNAHMQAGKAEEALAEYDKALGETPTEPGVHFNRGAALYGLYRWDEAGEAFLRATEARTPDLKAAAFYNLGNAFFQGQKYEEAAQAFKKSLAYNPGNVRAKWNLELALSGRRKRTRRRKSRRRTRIRTPTRTRTRKRTRRPEEQKDDKQEDKDNKDQQAGQQKQDQNNDGKNEPPKPDPAQQQAQQPEPPRPPEPKPGEQKPEPQPGKPEPEKPAKNQAAEAPPDKAPPKPADISEMEAILDNLERSPKALEQELARLRALNRRPPAKDW